MISDEKDLQRRNKSKMLGAFLLTAGIGIVFDVLLSDFFAIFESKPQILVKTLTFGILLIWILGGTWLLVWAHTSSKVRKRPHIENIKDFLIYASKEIEEQIEKYTISMEDEKKLKAIIKSLDRYLTKEVKY